MNHNLSQMQGTSWYIEQHKKTCQDGSRYCIYNHKICSNTACKYYHKQCVGKGDCDWFEPKTGTPKIYAEKTYTYKRDKDGKSKNKDKTKSSNPQNVIAFNSKNVKPTNDISNTNNINNTNDKKEVNAMPKQSTKHSDNSTDSTSQKTNKSKHEKFHDLAESRTDAVIKKIEILEKLSNTNIYEYTDNEVEQMFNEIENRLASAKQSFKNKSITRFKFK